MPARDPDGEWPPPGTALTAGEVAVTDNAEGIREIITRRDAAIVRIERDHWGYWYTISGDNLQGIAYRSDDEGPFPTREAALVAAYQDLRDYLPAPADLVDLSPGTARAEIIGWARTLVQMGPGPGTTPIFDCLAAALSTLDRIDRAAWRAQLAAHEAAQAALKEG